jgi:sugar lactone lactonase YvrE
VTSIEASLSIQRLGRTRCAVGESPLWAPAEQALYWVDIESRHLHRWCASSQAETTWQMPERPGCIALHAQGGLVCALESRIVHLRLLASGTADISALADVVHAQTGMRLNDGRCDRRGAFWVGSMLMNMAVAAPLGRLYRLAHGKGPAAALSTPLKDQPLVVPNGLAFSPSGDTLYLSDSHPLVRQIWAFKLHDDGSLSEQRVFVDMKQHPGRPDGAAVDVDGCLWTCANDAGLLHRFTPTGRLDRSIALPVSKPSMCAFGGPQMDELFITSIRPALPPAAEADLAGATFVCRPGVQGLAETPFKLTP